ncbi:hypothetical protein V6N13_073153 [Hibiscus sabdariffa]|uniref:Uncharacterized protein n=1 Tax=Hibiscus sabdariffa TaxID=183260 RepID=A0ABR2EBV5_9ROSI
MLNRQNLETTANFSNVFSHKHPLSQLLDLSILQNQIELFHSIARSTPHVTVYPIYDNHSNLRSCHTIFCIRTSIFRQLSLSFSLYYLNIMAQVCTSKPIVAIFVALVLSVSATVSAQGGAMAPSPSMDSGAAFSLPVSAVAVAFSLIVSFLALLKH